MNTVERLISKLQLNTTERILEEEAMLVVEVPLGKKARFLDRVKALYKVGVDEAEEK
jgi:hypothetical protein